MEYHCRRNLKNILIADDDREIVKLIGLYLEDKETKILEAFNGEEAYEISKSSKIDLAILDIMMPKLNGYDLIKLLRQDKFFPIIIISAKFNPEDKVLCLNLGADDYISKPFNTMELVARVKAHLRRQDNFNIEKSESINEYIELGNLILNVTECNLTINGEEIQLSAMEYKLLKKFMESPGRVFTKEQLFFDVWNSYDVDDNTIMVTISKIRSKIGNEKIITIRGLGYKFKKD